MSAIRAATGRVAQVILVSAALLPWVAQADGSVRSRPQIRRGEEIAQLQCSACHVVAEKQKYPPLLEDPAPSFKSIANRPQVSEAELRHFITTTHWDEKTVPLTMPNPGLTKPDIAAVIRYIVSLKGH